MKYHFNEHYYSSTFMRKQCLFDPNHLIDEFGFTKHLLNCQSKLKKDWRKCRYSDEHWQLYKYIEFHERCKYIFLSKMNVLKTHFMYKILKNLLNKEKKRS